MLGLLKLLFLFVINYDSFSVTRAAPRSSAIELIEGDIEVTEPLRQLINAGKKSRDKRGVTNDMIKRWPSSKIPYTLDPSLDNYALKAIKEAIQEYHNRTCVKFVLRTNETDYIEFQNNLGCFSSIGRQGGKQRLSVGEGCEYKGTVMHEIMHALGFFHEQSRYDRDNYIMILWWNIAPGFEKNFEAYSHDKVDSLDQPYDFDSLMHYDNLAFSENGDDTLRSLDDPIKQLGQMDAFSQIDVKQLMKVYPCPAGGNVNKKNPEEREEDECQDVFKQCAYFASFDGYCEGWRKYMNKWCPKSCNVCNTHSPKNRRTNLWREVH